jgi:DNA processing protein
VGGVTDEVLLARAFLNRIFEPAHVPLWSLVRKDGPVAVAAALRAGRLAGPYFDAAAARIPSADPWADLESAQRHGIRLVVPESDEWPHFAFAALEAAGLRRAAAWSSEPNHADSGELVPPIALWIRGAAGLATVGVRSVAIVGARGATEYGLSAAHDFAAGLAQRGFEVVSGGAHGIDAAAHRGALAVDGTTILVSAGGLDRPYPPANTELFERVAATGLLVSESPPGADPRRRRFLTRNRLIAALGTGTLVVEAARRSGAVNTATHSSDLGRPLMAMPGPITSRTSAGCHWLISRSAGPARLVSCVQDVLESIGASSDLELPTDASEPGAADTAGLRAARVDALDPAARRIFDAFPSRGWIGPDRLAVAAGVGPLDVIRALPALELAGLVEASGDGYRVAREPRVTAGTPP